MPLFGFFTRLYAATAPAKEPRTVDATTAPAKEPRQAPAKDLRIVDATPAPTEEPRTVDAITAPAEELRIVDAIPAPTKEPRTVDAITAPAEELRIVDAIPAPTKDLRIVDAVISAVEALTSEIRNAKKGRGTRGSARSKRKRRKLDSSEGVTVNSEITNESPLSKQQSIQIDPSHQRPLSLAESSAMVAKPRSNPIADSPPVPLLSPTVSNDRSTSALPLSSLSCHRLPPLLDPRLPPSPLIAPGIFQRSEELSSLPSHCHEAIRIERRQSLPPIDPLSPPLDGPRLPPLIDPGCGLPPPSCQRLHGLEELSSVSCRQLPPLLDPRCRSSPPILETPFVFEQPKPTYYLLDMTERDALLSLGPMAPARLVHIERIHVVFQSLSQTQVTIARRLDLPHYQATMAILQSATFESITYYKEGYRANEFLYVSTKHSPVVHQLLGTINFHQIGARLLMNKSKESVRQSFYEDYGICSSQCSSRTGDPLGISVPSGKPGNGDDLIKGLLGTCSEILRALGCRIFQFKPDRLRKFAGSLAQGNQIEAMRLALTDEGNLCGVHEDKRNDKDFPGVPVFSRFVTLNNKRYRVSIIMYSRQSISDYFKRLKHTYGPAVIFVMDAFSKLPPERRSILPGSFRSRESETFDCHGLAFSGVPCHMNPTFFVSPVIHFGLMITFHHRLDFAELVSIFRAWAAVPYTTYYFCSAVILLLQVKDLPVRGLLLGRLLLGLMNKLREDDRVLEKRIPGMRFSTYRKIIIPESEKWVSSTTELVRLCAEASYRPIPPGDKKERATFYENTRKAVAKEIPNAGVLITNHLMGVLAIVGLVPLWFASEHSVDSRSKSIQYLVVEKGLPSGKPAAVRFLDTLSSAFFHQYGIFSTIKFSENVGCKSFRLEGTERSDERFSDLVFLKQCVFEVVGSEVHVHRLGFRTCVVQGPLIDRWALGGRFWELPQLLLQFGSLTQPKFRLPPKLGDQGRSQSFPKWTVEIFPPAFVVKDLWKARAMVTEVVHTL
jgi:hypothetical protein